MLLLPTAEACLSEAILDEYRSLVAARKSCRVCIERSPGRIRSCAEFDFDPEVVSHWEQWLGHRQPKLLVVGQDFGNVDYFLRHRGRDDPANKTNANLHKLLTAVGIEVANPPDRDHEAPVFMTNSILCVKVGKMAAPIRPSWVAACTERHLVPLLRLLAPPVVVGMGAHGWQAVRLAFDLQEAPSRISHAVGGAWLTAGQVQIFAVVHCGPLGLTNRPWPQQFADWRRISEAVSRLGGDRAA